jgi:hypothetical protein
LLNQIFYNKKTHFWFIKHLRLNKHFFWQALKHSSFSTIYPYRCKKMGANYYRQQKEYPKCIVIFSWNQPCVAIESGEIVHWKATTKTMNRVWVYAW